MSTANFVARSGVKVYHDIWRAVATYFYDRQRLKEWAYWEHCFDDHIDGEASALIYARLMVESLKDRFTAIEVVHQPDATGLASSAEPVESESRVTCGRSKSNLGYIRILDFDAEDVSAQLSALIEKVAGCDGILLDLRHNSGGIVEQALECSEFFIEDGLLTTIERTVEGGVRVDERYVAADGGIAVVKLPNCEPEVSLFPRRAPLLAGKPCVILISDKTASSGELIAAAVIENAAASGVPCKTVGSRSRGKATLQHREQITETIWLVVTRGRYLSPANVWFGDAGQTVSNGLEADVPVAVDRGPEGLKAAADELRRLIASGKSA